MYLQCVDLSVILDGYRTPLFMTVTWEANTVLALRNFLRNNSILTVLAK